jgi:hypothetical protein
MSLLRKILGLPPPLKRGRLTSFDAGKTMERWRWVDDQIRQGRPNSLKLAILEADKIVDEVLKILYPDQANISERLKLARANFKSRQTYEDLWFCHKVRNLIAHEVSYDLPSSEAVNILNKYEVALRELGAL